MLEGGKSDKIVLVVMDTGVGIKVEDQPKLFKLFGTISSTKELNTKGVGLGLSITKMISQAFGGDTAVVSREEKGSIFVSSLEIPKLSGQALNLNNGKSSLERRM